MAGQGGISPDNILRGLFGSLVASAEAGEGTAAVWSNLRTAAASWAGGVLKVTLGRDPTDAEVQGYVSRAMSGITAADVSRYRGLAGQYLSAKNNLTSRNVENQIFGDSIWRAPWRSTGPQAGTEERFRVKVQWSIEFKGFQTVERSEWATYDLSGPLTSVADALRQARDAFEEADYNTRASITDTLDYVIEVV